MTALRQRARALENQFARQQEMAFKAEARRNAMLGRWAAGAMGLADADAYARQMTIAAVNEPHRLLDLLRRDFATAGVTIDEREIKSRMDSMLTEATEQLYRA